MTLTTAQPDTVTKPDLQPRIRPRRTEAPKNLPSVVITGAARTAIGKFGGGLAEVPAPKLGAIAIRAALERSGVRPEEIDEVILGNVISAGLGQNPARQAALGAGIPKDVGAFLINKVCASSLKAVCLAAQAIRAGDAEVVIAGGMENMSLTPYLLPKARTGYRLGNGVLVDAMINDGLWDPYKNIHMGLTGELVAEHFGVSRKDQDEYAYRSHQKALAAQAAGYFKDEIAPVPIPQKKGDPVLFSQDEGPRADTSLEVLTKLRPAFKEGGTVTAGNAPGVNDGAAALVVMNEDRAKADGRTPLARILGYYTGGLAPEWVMMTPVVAVRGLLARHPELTLDSFDLIELNEAFAVQAIAVTRELGLDPAKVNVNGGAVALGHPIGASGARILVTLLNALRQRGKKRGLATLCLGGGNGVAVAVELL